MTRPVATALALALAACTGGAAQGPAPVARCEIGDTTMIRDVLYFGRNRPTGGTVSDPEWQSFLNEVVTPRFPAGLTVVTAAGQWRGRSGAIEQEQSEIVTLFHGGDVAARRAIDDIMAEYKRRFQQEAVLRERAPTCTRFGARESHDAAPHPPAATDTTGSTENASGRPWSARPRVAAYRIDVTFRPAAIARNIMTTKIEIAMKKSTFAMPAAADAMPPNPNKAAISATTRKRNAHLSIIGSLLRTRPTDYQPRIDRVVCFLTLAPDW